VLDLGENLIRNLPPSRSALRLEEDHPSQGDLALELKIVPWSELKPHSDVFEADGKVRTGLLVFNNPVNWIDLDGRALFGANAQGGHVSITTAKGKSESLMSSGQLTSTLNNLPAGSVTSLVITGHSASSLIQLSDESQLSTAFDTKGNPIIIDENGNNVTAAFKRALAEDAAIRLRGCNTATGPDSLAEQFSEALPGVSVTGNAFYSLGSTIFGVEIFSLPATFKN